MINLKSWLNNQGLSVREFALELGVPLKTAQDWIYRGTAPSAENQQKLDEFIVCAHYWVIDAASGPVSQGTCQVCGEVREFRNSAETNFKTWTNKVDNENTRL